MESLDIIDKYIELKNLQIKYTPFEIIELGVGKLVKEEENSVILDFTIDQYNIDNLKHSSERLIDIDGEKYEFEILSLDKNHIAIRVSGYSGIPNEAKLLIDMSFIFKKQKEVLEELKSDNFSILREQLFGNNKIKGGEGIELINKSEQLNKSQKEAISYAIGVKDLFLIWGPPGTGKTTLVPEITKNYCDLWQKNNTGLKILLCAWTNTAVDNAVKKLYKENYNVVRYRNGVIKYGKGTTLNKDEYKEVLYDYQEKECIDRIEKEYASKLIPLESTKRETLQKIKDFETDVITHENELSKLRNECSEQLKAMYNQMDFYIRNLKESLISLFQTEISQIKNQIVTLENALANFEVEYKNTVNFIEELSKTIRQYEIVINDSKNEINKLEQKKVECRDILKAAEDYLYFIKQNKWKYIAYRAGVYSSSFLITLEKYGLHKKDYDTVLLYKNDVEQKLKVLDLKQKESIISKRNKEELKIGAERLLDEKRTIRESSEIKLNQLNENVKSENNKLDSLSKNLILVEKMNSGDYPYVENYFELINDKATKDKLLQLQKNIKKIITKIEKLQKESSFDIKENEVKIKALRDIILNLNRELEPIEKNIKSLETEKAEKLDNITALVLKRYDVIATTIFETPKIFKLIEFDLTIMDEAGSVEVPSALIPMIQSKKVIFLGDHKQLPPVIREDKRYVGPFLDENPEMRQSIFELLYKKVGSNNNCAKMLKEQYRMQKNIADFVSMIFYDNELKTSDNIKTNFDLKDGLDKIIGKEPQMIWFLREYWNEKDGGSWKCKYEVNLIKNIVANFKRAYGDEIANEIAVITPFKGQHKLIKKELPEIECGTVHKYQGQEKGIIIFSPAESNKFGPLFTGNKGRTLLNVAVSRTQQKFIMIGSNKIKKIPHYGQLYAHIAKTGLIIEDIIKDYDPHCTCPICGKMLDNPSYEFCFGCGQIKKLQNKIFNEKKVYKCKDTHMVRSSGEVRIDDWLSDNGIEHKCEEKLPFSSVLYCDWYLPKYDAYIEFWGSVHSKDDGAHRKYKEKLYKENGLTLVSIEDADLINLNDSLNHKLKRFV